MKTRRVSLLTARTGAAVVFALAAVPSILAAQAPEALPSPLSLADVVRLAGDRRDEIDAAGARTRAGEARPDIVSALEDPMILPSLDHLPFMLGGADVSVTIEQRIPLSGIRGHRRASALADVDRLRADARRTVLDVSVQAANAFLMLQDRRRTSALVDEQLTFARDVVNAANARYASGTAPQSDVLRAEVEVARLEALARALVSEVRGAEAMLTTSLALDADQPVPPLAPLVLAEPVPAWAAVKAALTERPELVGGRAEIARADADVQVMRDMFRPMATIRTGPAYTMAEGKGWMDGHGRCQSADLARQAARRRRGSASDARHVRGRAARHDAHDRRRRGGCRTPGARRPRSAVCDPVRRPAPGANGHRTRRGRLHLWSIAARQRH